MVYGMRQFGLYLILGWLLCSRVQAEEFDDPAAAFSAAPAPLAATDLFLTEQGDLRPAEQLTLQIFNRPLVVGGELEFAPDWTLERELDRRAEDAVASGEESATLEFLYQLSARTLIFLESDVFFESTWFTDNARDRRSAFGLARRQHWLFVQHLGGTPFSLQIGRQYIAEQREWWWDTELDGVRLYYEVGAVQAELMVAEELGATDTVNGFEAQEQDVRRVLGRLTWRWTEHQRFELFLLEQRDHSRAEVVGRVIERAREDPSDGDLTWFGLRETGSFKLPRNGRVHYWADTAIVGGDERHFSYAAIDLATALVDQVRPQEVSGWAIDLGLTWRTNLPHKPTLTLGLAVGSGDHSPNSGGSHAFIQTGLNENIGEFWSVNRFRYYGEFLRPELSNLAVSTVSIGTHVLANSSLQLVYHGYRQLHATSFVRNAQLDAEPGGRDPDLGDEIDLVLGIEESAHYEFEFVAGVFRAGDAFEAARGRAAGTLQIKLNYNF